MDSLGQVGLHGDWVLPKDPPTRVGVIRIGDIGVPSGQVDEEKNGSR